MLNKFYKGDTKIINLELKDKDGIAINLSGATIYFTAKTDLRKGDVDAEIQKIITTHTDENSGKSRIKLSPADSTNLTAGIYFYDIQLKDSVGDITTLYSSKFELLEGVTKTI